MNDDEYLKETRSAVNFLMHCFNTNMLYTAQVATAQAEHNTKKLIDLLELVKTQIENWIAELKLLK